MDTKPKTISLSTDILDKSIWKVSKFSGGQAYVDLLLLTRGSKFTTSLDYLPQRWGWDMDTFKRFMEHQDIIPMFTFNLVGPSLEVDLVRRKKVKPIKNEERRKLVIEFAKELLIYYNNLYKKSYKTISPFTENLEYWMGRYSKEEIKEAIKKAREDDFWQDKMTLVILFRQKNTKMQPVDYIGDLLNRKKKSNWTQWSR